jgi:predicted nucleotidyltransferase component of viral defense system
MLKKTKKVLDRISHHEFFSLYDIRFVGGTALSYLIHHRLSEDLDFAMLELAPESIKEMMNSFGATLLQHNITAVEYAKNDGENLENYHLKFLLNDVKVEFFTPPFNLFEKEIWENESITIYENSNLKVASFKTIMYMKTMAFWNRKKYRDLFDIYYVLHNYDDFNVETFVELYLKYNITYDKKTLYEKVKSKNSFYEKLDDEGLYTLVEDPKPYEWYRNKIENMLYQVYLDELYSKS